MDVVTVGKKEYRKATLVARDFGYTKDYLGQLCRSEKVDARLVGRTWYVNSDSIEAHKKTKQRSNLEKSKKALRESVGSKVEVRSRQAANKNFFDHLPKATKITNYEEDDAELVPLVPKKEQSKHRLQVELADAQKLKIESKTEGYVISASKHPRIRFKGDVAVESHEDEEQFEAESVESKLKESGTVVESEEEPKPILRVVAAQSESDVGEILVEESGKDASTEVDEVAHLPIHSEESTKIPSGRLLFVMLSASTVMLLLVGALSVGLETTVVATAETVTETYSFSIQNLLAQIYIEK